MRKDLDLHSIPKGIDVKLCKYLNSLTYKTGLQDDAHIGNDDFCTISTICTVILIRVYYLWLLFCAPETYKNNKFVPFSIPFRTLQGVCKRYTKKPIYREFLYRATRLSYV